MEATQTVRHPQDATPPGFETVWAILQEVGKKQEELAESQKETARQMQETDRRLDKQLGKLGNQMGEIVEYMVAPNLREKFRELGLNFPHGQPKEW
jgi:predicted transcriptional regulator